VFTNPWDRRLAEQRRRGFAGSRQSVREDRDQCGFDPLGQRLLVQSKALAGFFQRADGEWQVFNVVVNDAGGAPDITAALSANEDVGEVAAQLWKEANPAGR
jgi:hypothetical protein